MNDKKLPIMKNTIQKLKEFEMMKILTVHIN